MGVDCRVSQARSGRRPAPWPAADSLAGGCGHTQPGPFELAGEGLCAGPDSGDPITADYPGEPPFRFTGGTIRRVVVDVSGEPYVDLAREAQAMLARE